MKHLLVLFCASLFWTGSARCAELSPVDQYVKYLRSIERIRFTSVFRDRSDSSTAFTNSLQQEWKLDLQSKQSWCRTQRVPLDENGVAQQIPSGGPFSEVVLRPDRMLEVNARSEGTDREQVTVMSYLDLPDDYWATDPGLLYLKYPLGYFEMDGRLQYLPDYLSDASVSENHGIVSVEATQPEGIRVQLDLSPSHDWAPRRIEIAATGELDVDKIEYVVEEFQNTGEMWFPKKYTCTVSQPSRQRELPPGYRLEDGVLEIVESDEVQVVIEPSVKLMAEVVVSDVTPVSIADSRFELEFDIANGTVVAVQDASHLDFVWEDGEIVPNPGILPPTIGDASFRTGKSRTFIVVVNAAILGVLVLLFVRSRRVDATRN